MKDVERVDREEKKTMQQNIFTKVKQLNLGVCNIRSFLSPLLSIYLHMYIIFPFDKNINQQFLLAVKLTSTRVR